MKNLLKLFVVVLVCTMTTESFAQRIGVKAGLNLSNMLMKDDDDTYSDDYKMLPGFHVGVIAEIPFNDMISFEPGLLLSTKGFKYEYNETLFGFDVKEKAKMNLYYIDIPLNFKASFEVGDANIYGAIGPYIGYGISGKIKAEATVMGETETETEDINWGSDEEKDDLKPLDLGLTVGAGLEYNSFLFGISYGYGLANISPYTDDGSKISNRVLGISVGYMIGER